MAEIMEHAAGFLAFLWDNLTPSDRFRIRNGAVKTAWIFGAGASHHYAMNPAGVSIPLANGFFEAFHNLPTSEGFQAHIGPLVNYLYHSRGIQPAEVYKWRENIEDFMTSIEQEIDDLRSTVNTGKNLHKDQLEKSLNAATCFNNMAFICANVINESQNGPSDTAYHELLKFCSPDDVFLTFNWDTLLDRALADSGCWSPNNGYGLKFESILDGCWKSEMDSSQIIQTNLRLLKLHGSTNWLIPLTSIQPMTLEEKSIVPGPEKIFLYWHGSLPFSTFKGRWRGGYAPTCYGYYPPSLPFSSFSEESLAAPPGYIKIRMTPAKIFSPFKEPEDNGLVSAPLLITPVRQKQYDKYASSIESVWSQSQEALLSADRIVIVGYSFPPTDIRPLEILRATLQTRKGEISLEIIDPYANEIADRIGHDDLANARSVEISCVKFEDYLGQLWKSAPGILAEAASKDEDVQKWIASVQMMIEASPYVHKKK
jgi:hypothetical protein